MIDSVLWLGAGAPPSLLTAHLHERGLSLITLPSERAEAEQMAWPARRIAVLDVLAPPLSGRAALAGRRIALVQPDPGRADSLAQALRARGAEVVALGLAFEAFQRAELLDPDVVLVEPDYFYGECWSLIEAVWRHPRLRWATVLLMPPEALDSGGLSLPDVRPLCAAIQGLSAPVEQLRMLSRGCERFDVELDRLGPARTLRVLVDTDRTLRAEFSADEAVVDIDVAKELVIGARGERRTATREQLFGPAALSACLGLARGRVSVRAVTHPAVANVMAPFDAALHLAQEPSASLPGDDTTHPRAFEEVPTRPWDDDFLAPSTHFDPFDLVDVSVSTPLPAPPAEPSLVTNVGAVRAVGALGMRIDSTAAGRPASDNPGARQALDTLPFRSQPWARKLIPSAIAVGAAVGAVLWLAWPRAQPSAAGARASVSVGEVRTTPAHVAPEPALPAAAAPSAGAPTGNTPSAAAPSAGATNADEPAVAPAEDSPAPSAQGATKASELADQAAELQQRGQVERARAKYLEALALAPSSARAQAGLVRLALARSDESEAVRYAQQLVRDHPGQAAYQLLLGDAYRLAKKPGLARTAYRTALRLGSTKARARLMN